MAKQSHRARPLILWLGAIVVSLAIAALAAYRFWPMSAGADADDPARIARGQQIYAADCASCHGENLEGQPDWRIRLENGRLPAPPHDADGHTWHHPDEILFAMTKAGIQVVAGLEDYETDMPAFEEVLSDEEIRAVLAYIKSTWPPEIRVRQDAVSRRYRNSRGSESD